MTHLDRDTAGALEREAAAWLARLRANDPADQAPFEQWYASDSAHADAYDRVLRSWQATRRLGELGAGRAADLAGARRRGLPYAAIAVAAVILLGIGLSIAPRRPPTAPAPRVSLATRTGEIRMFRLPDGSAVTLDTDSAIEAPLSGSRQTVRLVRGRAGCDVPGGTQGALAVETAAGQVTVDEGRLDVALDGGLTEVALWQGRADVRPHTGPGVYRRLVAGDALAFGGTTPPRATPAVDTRWTSGMLSFTDAPLARVIMVANRYAATPIRLDTVAIGGRRFTGTFRATDTHGLARMAAVMFDLSVSTDDQGRILLTARPPR